MAFSTIAGCIGAVLILIAYYLVSSEIVTAQSMIYQIMNLFGAAGLAYNTFTQKAWPTLVLNVIWALIAIKILLF